MLKMNTNSDFAAFVRGRRLALGKTQADIAGACGLSEQSITLIEAGRRHISWERVPSLAIALEVGSSELCLLALRARCPQFAAALAHTCEAGL